MNLKSTFTTNNFCKATTVLLVFLLCFSLVSFSQGAISLLDRNPFKFTNADEPAEDTSNVKLEEIEALEDVVAFHGSYKLNDLRYFSLKFKEIDQNKWLQVDDQLYGVKILDFVEDQLSLYVEYNNEKGLLKLADSGKTGGFPGEPSVSRRISKPSPEKASAPANTPPISAPKRDFKPPTIVPRRVPKPKEVDERFKAVRNESPVRA